MFLSDFWEKCKYTRRKLNKLWTLIKIPLKIPVLEDSLKVEAVIKKNEVKSSAIHKEISHNDNLMGKFAAFT